MLKILLLLLIICLGCIGYGYYEVEYGSPEAGHQFIGVATIFMFLVIMPLFIVNRYKGKDLSQFRLDQSDDKDRKKKDPLDRRDDRDQLN